MRFQIDPLPSESQRACRAIVQAALPPSRINAVLIALYAAVALAAFVFTPATRATTLIIGVAAVMATAWAIQVESRTRVRRLQRDDPHALETHFIEIGPEGVHTWCAHIDARYPWSDFASVAETGEFYLLVRPSGNGVAIPKRLLNENTRSELLTGLREWAPDRAAGLSRKAA